jgi:hypothetical protein
MEEQRNRLNLTEEQRAPFVEVGKAGAARRARVPHACEVCGTPFEGLRQARYCSNRCAVRASRQRRKAGEQGATEETQQ